MAATTYVALTGFNYPDPDDDENEIRVEPGEKVSLPEAIAKKLRSADVIATPSDVKKIEQEEKAAAAAEAEAVATAEANAIANQNRASETVAAAREQRELDAVETFVGDAPEGDES